MRTGRRTYCFLCITSSWERVSSAAAIWTQIAVFDQMSEYRESYIGREKSARTEDSDEISTHLTITGPACSVFDAAVSNRGLMHQIESKSAKLDSQA